MFVFELQQMSFHKAKSIQFILYPFNILKKPLLILFIKLTLTPAPVIHMQKSRSLCWANTEEGLCVITEVGSQ